MKRMAILGGVALCLSLTACGEPTAEEILIEQLGEAGYTINESNYDMIIATGHEVCGMNQQEFDDWRAGGDFVEIAMYGEANDRDSLAWRTFCINTMPEDTLPEWNFN